MIHPQLAAVVTQLEAAQERLHSLAARTPSGRWSKRMDPARWSVGECVVHLNLTSKAFLPLFRSALDDPALKGVRAPARYRRDAIGWLLGMFTGPMPRLGNARVGRMKTTAAFVPASGARRDLVVAEFNDLQAQLIAFARESDGRPLDRMRVVSPFDSRASYNMYSALLILPAHQQRHLEQAEQVWGAA